jgi:hypothetical protein
MLEIHSVSWDNHAQDSKPQFMNFVEHPGGVLSIHLPTEHIPQSIFNKSHEFRPVTTEQIEVLQRLWIILNWSDSTWTAWLVMRYNKAAQSALWTIWGWEKLDL